MFKIHIERFGEDERKKCNLKPFGKLISVIIGIVVLLKLCFVFEKYILENKLGTLLSNNIDAWICSLPSYWGGILGGIISGILSVVGIMITINYYRQNDIKNRMVERQPYFRMDVKSAINSQNNSLFSLQQNEKLASELECEIENIGRGLAQVLTFHVGINDIGGKAFYKLVNAGEVIKHFHFSVSNEDAKYRIAITFFDEFRNEYIQEFEVITEKCSNPEMPKVEILSYYPNIISKNLK